MEGKKNGITRRSVIKQFSVSASISMIGFSGMVAAEKQNINKKERKSVLKKEQIQVILEEIDHPHIQSHSKYGRTLNGKRWSIIEFETEIGNLKYIESSEKHPVAIFTFDDVTPDSSLPKQYSDVPNINEASIIAESEETRLIRELTKQERSVLKSLISDDISDAIMLYDTKIGGFVVVDYTINKRYVFGAGKIENVSDPNVQFFLTASCDAGACTQCALTLASGAGGCTKLCKYVRYLGYPGIAACAACVIAAGVWVVDECNECVDSC